MTVWLTVAFLFPLPPSAQGLLPGGRYPGADRGWNSRGYDRGHVHRRLHERPVRRGAQLQPDEDQSSPVGHGKHWERWIPSSGNAGFPPLGMLDSLHRECCTSLLGWSKAQAQQGTRSCPGRCSLLKFSVCATEQALPGSDGSPGKAAPCPRSQEAQLPGLALHKPWSRCQGTVMLFQCAHLWLSLFYLLFLCAGTRFLSSSQQMCFSFV